MYQGNKQGAQIGHVALLISVWGSSQNFVSLASSVKGLSETIGLQGPIENLHFL